MSAVSRQIGYSDYLNFLIFGKSDAWGSLKDSGEVVLIQRPADFDLGKMKKKVTEDEWHDRVVVSEDKKCIIDGICILNTPNRTSFLQIGSAIEQAMRNIALGSAVSATAVAVSHLVVAKYSYIRLIALMGSVAMTCFALLRYWQAYGRVREVQNHLHGMGNQVAIWRKECYFLKEAEGLKVRKCLQPFEGEALFKHDFSTWAALYLALQTRTSEEKERWVKTLLTKTISLRKQAEQLLDDGCVGSSTLKDTVAPVFEAWAKFERAFGDRENEYATFKELHKKNEDAIITLVWQGSPWIIQAKDNIMKFKIAKCCMDFDKPMAQDICSEYFWMACEAAYEGTELEEVVKWISLGKNESFCIHSYYYDKARIFLGEADKIVQTGQGIMPELKKLSEIPPVPKKEIGNVLQGQKEAFLGRARKRVPIWGTVEEYEKFLKEIFEPGQFKISSS